MLYKVVSNLWWVSMNFAFQELFPNAPRGVPRTVFDVQYHCFSVAVSGRAHLEDGDKILLPPSALDTLARMNVAYPMLFELTNGAIGKRTHCGVLEFTAEEGRCYVPFWMMQNLFMEEGALLSVKNVTLPKATYVKFQAQSVDFIKINNPRAVLEVTLRKFTCVTKGDMICLPYAGQKYFLEVTEVKPGEAASIVESDVKVDFDEPRGYQESEYGKAEKAAKERKLAEEQAKAAEPVAPRSLQRAVVETADAEEEKKFVPFSGASRRIDGRKVGDTENSTSSSTSGSGRTIGGSTQSSSSAASGTASGMSASGASASTADTSGATKPFQYRSSVGNKYAKTKTSVSAFGGAGRKLG